MATKGVNIFMLQRDENGDVSGSTSTYGTTEDEGATVLIGLGYVPGIENAPVTDIELTLLPLPVQLPTPASVSRTDDVEANTSTLVFS